MNALRASKEHSRFHHLHLQACPGWLATCSCLVEIGSPMNMGSWCCLPGLVVGCCGWCAAIRRARQVARHTSSQADALQRGCRNLFHPITGLCIRNVGQAGKGGSRWERGSRRRASTRPRAASPRLGSTGPSGTGVTGRSEVAGRCRRTLMAPRRPSPLHDGRVGPQVGAVLEQVQHARHREHHRARAPALEEAPAAPPASAPAKHKRRHQRRRNVRGAPAHERQEALGFPRTCIVPLACGVRPVRTAACTCSAGLAVHAERLSLHPCCEIRKRVNISGRRNRRVCAHTGSKHLPLQLRQQLQRRRCSLRSTQLCATKLLEQSRKSTDKCAAAGQQPPASPCIHELSGPRVIDKLKRSLLPTAGLLHSTAC